MKMFYQHLMVWPSINSESKSWKGTSQNFRNRTTQRFAIYWRTGALSPNQSLVLTRGRNPAFLQVRGRAAQVNRYGYEILSNEFENANTEVTLKCPKGHVYKTKFVHFRSGSRCPQCGRENTESARRLKFDDVKQFIEEQGYILLSTEYKNSSSFLDIKCPKGHSFKMTYNKFHSGRRCPICAENNRGDSLKFSYDFVMKYIEAEGYILSSREYKNVDTKLKMKCDKGHIFYMSFWNFKNGNRCPVCWKTCGTSRSEKEIQNFVFEIDERALFNDRTQIINPITGNNLELDVWLPHKRKAIEFNGKYWHSRNGYSKLKDKIKKEQCGLQNIELLVVDEEDWMESKEKVFDKIENFIDPKEEKEQYFTQVSF